jgi:hypothetical protein
VDRAFIFKDGRFLRHIEDILEETGIHLSGELNACFVPPLITNSNYVKNVAIA